jgi:hypothetical protein
MDTTADREGARRGTLHVDAVRFHEMADNPLQGRFVACNNLNDCTQRTDTLEAGLFLQCAKMRAVLGTVSNLCACVSYPLALGQAPTTVQFSQTLLQNGIALVLLSFDIMHKTEYQHNLRLW